MDPVTTQLDPRIENVGDSGTVAVSDSSIKSSSEVNTSALLMQGMAVESLKRGTFLLPSCQSSPKRTAVLFFWGEETELCWCQKVPNKIKHKE